MAGGGEKCAPGTQQKVDESGATTCVGGPALDQDQNTIGNAAVIQMLQDKKLAGAVSALQLAAEQEVARRAQEAATAGSNGVSSYPLEITSTGTQSDGYAYWRGESRREPIWDLTFEAMPELSYVGTDEGYLMDTQKVLADMQASITFEGETFEDWGVASYRYGARFDVSALSGAVATSAGWGLVGTM